MVTRQDSETHDALIARIDKIIARRKLPWAVSGNAIEVSLAAGERRHRVMLRYNDDHYVFTAVVAGKSLVTRSEKAWRDLAYWAWRKNSRKDLVGFAFDKKDRLLGVIEQPIETLDDEELIIYIQALAEECDRFEYKLTGKDRE
jgi:hypothetical protein